MKKSGFGEFCFIAATIVQVGVYLSICQGGRDRSPTRFAAILECSIDCTELSCTDRSERRATDRDLDKTLHEGEIRLALSKGIIALGYSLHYSTNRKYFSPSIIPPAQSATAR